VDVWIAKMLAGLGDMMRGGRWFVPELEEPEMLRALKEGEKGGFSPWIQRDEVGLWAI
jgi:hypothetical protein